jgi:hypothetical protein
VVLIDDEWSKAPGSGVQVIGGLTAGKR